MRLSLLLEQIDARAEVGLPTQQFRLALHNRFAYPLADFPATLLAVGLAIALGRWGVMAAWTPLVMLVAAELMFLLNDARFQPRPPGLASARR